MTDAQHSYAIAGPTLFDGEQFLEGHCLVVQNAIIADVIPLAQRPPSLPLTQLDGGTLAPGFVDLQVNGGGDVMLQNAPTVETIETIQAAHRSLGTTSFLPTLLSDTLEVQQAALDAVTTVRNSGNRNVLGLHIEGPFFNIARRGAHQAGRIRKPLQQEIDWLCSQAGVPILLTLAPEEVAREHIEALTAAGIILCAGHTNATYEQVMAAAAQGVQGITHLYNAMSQITPREPGAVGAALDNDRLWAGIIADGHHVHAAGIRAAHAAKPPGKLLLVSDAMATVGGSKNTFELYAEEITEREGKLVNADGALAGSAIGLIDAVRYCHQQVGIDLTECLRMASLYPAVALSEDDNLGRLCSGYRADLVHFDDNWQVQTTWVSGQAIEHRQ